MGKDVCEHAACVVYRAENGWRACALCAETNYAQWYRVNGYDIGKCRQCGLVQVLDDLTDAQIATFYGSGYYNGQDKMVYQDYLSTAEAKIEHFGEQLDQIVSECDIQKPGRYLELGCAYGLAMLAARNRGWSVRGIELSSHAAASARDQFGLDVDDSPNGIDRVESQSQDLVVMWDVVEHLRDPVAVLKQIRRVLVPGGLLVFATVNIASIGARFYGKRWFLMSPPYHLVFFDRQTAGRMLENCGYRIKSIRSSGGHPLENLGRNRLLQWIANNDHLLGWRLHSGPGITVTAIAEMGN